MPPNVVERFHRPFKVYLKSILTRYFDPMWQAEGDPFAYRTRWHEARNAMRAQHGFADYLLAIEATA